MRTMGPRFSVPAWPSRKTNQHAGHGRQTARPGQSAAMRWYAETGPLRTRQLLTDAAVAAWVLLWLRIGVAVHDAVQRLGAPGRELEQAGRGLAGGLSGAADRTDDVPLLGDELRAPLDAAAGAGEALARAGVAQQDAVGTLALVLALVLAGLPVAWALQRWWPGRLLWARTASAAVELRGDVELFALRAAVHRPLAELATLGPDPVGRWRRGEPGAAEALAALERRAAGLR